MKKILIGLMFVFAAIGESSVIEGIILDSVWITDGQQVDLVSLNLLSL